MSGRLQGQRAWLLQRLTAIFLVLYALYGLGYLILVRPEGYAAWSAWLHPGGPMATLTTLFFLALLLHAWVGGRDIVLDYVHCLGARIGLLSTLVLFLLACGVWAIRILVVGP